MPKQIFQRPAPIKHQKGGNQKGSPFGQSDFNRKKGPKPAIPVKKATPVKPDKPD